MKVRFNLYLQTLSMLILYLATLAFIVFLCFNAQFGIGWEAALQSPMGERFETIAGAISSQLHASKAPTWPEVLQGFEDLYHVNFYIFDIRGNQIGGETINLPAAVKSRVTPEMPPPPPGEGGPPFDRSGLKSDNVGPPPDQGKPAVNRGGPPPEEDNPAFKHTGPPPGTEFPHAGGGEPPREFSPAFGPGGYPTFPGRHHRRPPASMFMHAHGRFIVHTTSPDRFWICTHIFAYSPKIGFDAPALLVAGCDNLWQTSLLFDLKFFASIFATIFILSLIFWLPFIYRITSALSGLTKATESIAQGKFDTRINAAGDDEIGRLSEAVDTMAERLEGYVREQKRLLADISHELFSPLARLQLALAILESTASDEQQSQVNDIREEVDEMNSLVSELIAYSKAGMQAKTPELSAVNLKNVIDSLVPRLTAGDKIAVELSTDVSVLADRLLLDRAISNVLRNGIRYAGDFGPITIKATRENELVVLSIIDHGPGVNEDALKHLGEPFYRPESSRNRSSGGFGLGLAIVKSCVEACQGTVTLCNTKPAGLTVELRLKLA